MAVLGVVPREERPAKSGGLVDAGETTWEPWVVLQGLELRLGERIVVRDLGSTQRACDPEVGEELRGALARHRCPTVGVQGKRLQIRWNARMRVRWVRLPPLSPIPSTLCYQYLLAITSSAWSSVSLRWKPSAGGLWGIHDT